MLLFLMQVSTFWIIGWLIYAVFLSKETFHQWNRIYLFAVIIIGLVVPFLELASPIASMPTYLLPTATIVATVPNQLPEIQVSASPAWEWDSLLWSVYLLGVLVNIFLFFKELITLYRLYEKSPKKKCEGYTWVDASSIKNPFSFWYLLFWNESPEQSEHHYILKHELAHIQQWHSLDKLILQLLSIVLWWHPMIYLFKRSFYELHEFLADRAAAQEGNKKQYGQLLLHYSAMHKNPLCMGNTFIQSPIKKRILMLLQPMSSKKNVWKYLATLPLLVLTVFACQQENLIAQSEELLTTNEQVAEMDTVITFNPETGKETITLVPASELETALEKQKEKKLANQNVDPSKIAYYSMDTLITFDPDTYEETMSLIPTPYYKEVDQMPVFGNCKDLIEEEAKACSDKALINYLLESIQYPEVARKSGVEGQVLTRFIIRSDGRICDFEILKKVSPEIDAEVKRVIRQMPQWQAGRNNGEQVNVQFTLPVKFKL